MLIAHIDFFEDLAHLKVYSVDMDIALTEGIFAILLNSHEHIYQFTEIASL